MITIRNVSKTFGAAAVLREVSLTAEEGKTTILLGVAGAGKTLLSDIACGAMTPDSGEVVVDGYDLTRDPLEAKRHIGYMPEDAAMYRDMTPRGQLKFIGQTREMRARALNELTEKVLSQTKLQDMANTPIRQLPAAYVQRVGIAQAIMGEVKTLVLDCPTRDLDPKQIFELRDILRDVREDRAVLLTTDSVTEALSMGDVVYVLDGGRIVGKCEPKDLAALEIDDDVTVLVCEGDEEKTKAAAKKAGYACERCEPDAGYTKAWLKTGKGAEARKALFWAFAQANLPIIDMRPEKRSVKDVVMALTSEPFARIDDEQPDPGKATANAEEGAKSR